jgi:hypothetical protein
MGYAYQRSGSESGSFEGKKAANVMDLGLKSERHPEDAQVFGISIGLLA